MLTLLSVVLCFLLSQVIHGVDLQYMSFWEYSPYDFEGWTNFAFTNNLTQIAIGTRLGIKHLFTVESIFFETGNVTQNGTSVEAFVLRPDYQTQWNNNVPLFKQLFNNGSIFGFFMGDELVWNGLNPVDLNTACQCIRNDFQTAILYTNEATGPMYV